MSTESEIKIADRRPVSLNVMYFENSMRTACDICFHFDELAFAEFDSAMPQVSRTLNTVLTQAPSFARCSHHGVYNYDCSLGAYDTIRIEKTGLFVIMHDGKRFDSHPLVDYLKSKLPRLFPDVTFTI